MKSRSPLRRDIQGLRALAVLLVILSHAFGIPAGGFIGVDVFFVISGFVITTVLIREQSATGKVSLKSFYIKRVRRIAPAALTVIGTTVILGALLLPRDRFTSLWWDALSGLGIVTNWRMAATETDYFHQALPPSALQHYWSLAVEEQFYLFWPLVVIAVLRLVARKKRALAILFVVALFATSFVGGVLETQNHPNAAYFSSFARFWELGVGAGLAFFTPIAARLSLPARAIALSAGSTMLVLSIFLISPDTPFPGAIALLPTIGTMLIIGAGTGADQRYNQVIFPLTNPVAQHLGDLSYSLYLWHFPVVVLLPLLLPLTPIVQASMLVAIWGLSYLTYKLVEDPIRRSPWLTKKPSPKRFGRILATAIVICTATSMLATAPLFLSPLHPESADTVNPANECAGAKFLQHVSTCKEPQVAGASQFQSDDGGVFSSDCWRGEHDPPRSCVFGSKRSDALEVALIGDSHAAMYIPALKIIASNLNWRITTHVGWGCQWVAAEPGVCKEQFDLAQQHTAAGDYSIVLTAAWRGALNAMTAEDIERSAALWQAAADSGSRILALESVPILSSESIQCAQRPAADPASAACSTLLMDAVAQQDSIALIATSMPESARIIGTADLVCRETACSPAIGGVFVFRDDGGHLTATYVSTMASFLETRIRSALQTLP